MSATPANLDDLFAFLRALGKPDRATKRVPLDDLEHRLREALRRAAAGEVVADGYPKGGDGGGSTGVSRPTENTVLGQYRPVEVGRRPATPGPCLDCGERPASRPDGRCADCGPMALRVQRDVVKEDAERALVLLLVARRALENAVARLDHLEKATGTPEPMQLCQSCIRVGAHTPMEHYGDVSGKLPTPWRLCYPCLLWISKHDSLDGLQAYLERRHMVGERGRARVTPRRRVPA